jgi:hypothetical protein
MPPEARILSSATYAILNERATRLEHESGQSRGKLEVVESELRSLRENRAQYEELIQVRASAHS